MKDSPGLTQQILEIFSYLKRLLKKPIDTIQEIPQFRLPSLIIVQAIICTGSVLVSNLISPYAIQPLTLALSILISFAALSFLALSIHYFFYWMLHRDLGFRSLYALVLFSWLPFAILHFFYYYLPIVHILGVALSLAMLTVGLSENYRVPRKNSLTISYCLFALFTGIWGWNQYEKTRDEVTSLSPLSLDAMEQKIKKTGP